LDIQAAVTIDKLLIAGVNFGAGDCHMSNIRDLFTQ